MKTNKFTLHANGVPPAQVKQFEAVARAAMRAGCDLPQARAVATIAHAAAAGFPWRVDALASGLSLRVRGITPRRP